MSSSKISILFVEDDPDLGNVLTLYLHMNGFEVSHFENGRDAIKALGSLTPDICLLDVNIPEIDGFELAQQIKGKRAIPFIFLTARKQKEDRLKGLQLGADDYITKPFEADELVLETALSCVDGEIFCSSFCVISSCSRGGSTDDSII